MTADDLAKRQDAIFAMLAKRGCDLERYARTLANLKRTDVSADTDYQRDFNALYGLRRNALWRGTFYWMLESCKACPEVDFGEVLMELLEKTGRVEASFASKLIATVNPKRAIYDSIVRENLGIPSRTYGSSRRIERLCEDYEAIQLHHEKQIEAQAYRSLRGRFDREFPKFQHFSDLKVLDLMIWQAR